MSKAIFIGCLLSSFPLVVHHRISRAVVVRRLRPLPLSSSAVPVVVVCRCHCPPPPSSAVAAVIATLCLRRLSPPIFVLPFCSLRPNLACRCRPPLSLSTFAIVVRRRCLLLPQPSSPLLSLPSLTTRSCPSPLQSTAQSCVLSSSATVVICHHHYPPLPYLHSSSLLQDVDCCRISHAGPPQQVICDGINIL